MDTLPSPYYDMLVGNAFLEFRDLIYFVGRIEDGIKRGKIMDTRASILEKKMIIFNEHVQAMTRERISKKKITYDTGWACQEFSSLIVIHPSTLHLFTSISNAHLGKWSRDQLKCLSE